MLSLSEIKRFYPENLHGAGEFLIREYLQFKILQIVYESKFARSLIFLGGSCIRIVYGNTRFSEDLDFDNLGLSELDFSFISDIIHKELELQGYDVEIKAVQKGAYHCYIRFPGLLFESGLSSHLEQKILIQLDTEPQKYSYDPETYLLNKFDVFCEIFLTPPATLLAQKFFAILNRKRNKGRDFYDIVFLLGMINEPDWRYLDEKLDISNRKTLKEAVLTHCNKIDMNEMAEDVEPFLFKAADNKRVINFAKLVEQKF